MNFRGNHGQQGQFLSILIATTALAGCGGVAVTPNASNQIGSSSTTTSTASAVTLSSTAYTVAPSSSAIVTINRSGPSTGSATVNYATVNGTATAGTDFAATSGSVTWADGDSSAKVVTVSVAGSASGKNFGFALTSVQGHANFGSPAAALVEVTGSSVSSASSSGSGSSGSGSSSGSAISAGNVFPQIGLQTFTGTQYYSPANDAKLAQYGLIILGGNYPTWPLTEGRTRDQVVMSLKTQTHVGRNALTPLIFQYDDANEIDPLSPWFPEWSTAVNTNNWFLYTLGSSGTKALAAFSPTFAQVDMAHVVGTDRSTGLYPYALFADLLYQRYYLGTGSGGAAMASTHLDGYFIDDLPQRNLAGSAADWERNGTDPSQTDPAATALVTLGKADYPVQLQVLNPTLIAGGNAEMGYDMSPNNAGGLGMTFSNLTGKLGLTMQQFVWDTAGGYSNALNFAGFNGAMTWYRTIEANTKTGGYVLMTGGVLATDYQLVRYSLALTLMRNGWAVYAISSDGFDIVDPTDLSTYPVFDEFWGGSLDTAGYLGNASNTTQGAEQSAPWSQGVWRRDFENGIVLVNPNTNGSQTVQLGGTFYHLSGSQVPSINNGAAVTSVTIPAGDGLILLRNAPQS
jgi:hypothetical protein